MDIESSSNDNLHLQIKAKTQIQGDPITVAIQTNIANDLAAYNLLLQPDFVELQINSQAHPFEEFLRFWHIASSTKAGIPGQHEAQICWDNSSVILAAQNLSSRVDPKTIPENLKKAAGGKLLEISKKIYEDLTSEPFEFYFFLKSHQLLEKKISIANLLSKIQDSTTWKQWAYKYRVWDEILLIVGLEVREIQSLDDLVSLVEFKSAEIRKSICESVIPRTDRIQRIPINQTQGLPYESEFSLFLKDKDLFLTQCFDRLQLICIQTHKVVQDLKINGYKSKTPGYIVETNYGLIIMTQDYKFDFTWKNEEDDWKLVQKDKTLIHYRYKFTRFRFNSYDPTFRMISFLPQALSRCQAYLVTNIQEYRSQDANQTDDWRIMNPRNACLIRLVHSNDKISSPKNTVAHENQRIKTKSPQDLFKFLNAG